MTSIPLPFLSASRCVLLLSDEAVHVFDVTPSRVRLVDSVAWQSDALIESLSAIMRDECGGRSVVILNDMVEQHYRKERIPSVSPLDRARVVERRLQVAFPSYPVRAALALKEKQVKTLQSADVQKRALGGVYLFSAVPMAEPLVRIIEAVRHSLVRVTGFFLLPVESADMVKALSKKLDKGAQSNPQWVVFIGQHHSGGLRQIVIRNGELALTRITPIVDTDIEPDLWAREVANEYKATMSYLSRFGYTPEDGLRTIVISNMTVRDNLEAYFAGHSDLHLMNAGQAAQAMGMKIGAQEDLRYADVLHVGWVGRKNSFTMPMRTPQIDAVAIPRRVAGFVALACMGALAYLGFMIFTNLQATLILREDAEGARQQLSVIEQAYQDEIKRKEELGFDVVLIRNSLKLYEGFEKDSFGLIGLVQKIGKALGPNLKIDSLKIDTAGTRLRKEMNGDGQEVSINEKMFNAVFKLSFSSRIDPEKSVKEVNDLVVRLRAAMPQYEVSIVKQVADLSYTGNFVGESGINRQVATKDYEAEISIKGVI